MSSYEKQDYYQLLYPIARFGLDRKFSRSVEGIEYIPDGAAIFTPNHSRIIDSPLLAATYTEETGRPMRFLIKKEYLEGEGIDGEGKYGRSIKWLMEHSGMIPVDRESKDLRALQKVETDVEDCLDNGDAVSIHSESTRTVDGRLYKYKSGAARIAMKAMVPLVPVGIMYSEYDNARKTHAHITFGKPIMPAEFNQPPYSLIRGNGPKAKLLIQEIENRVAALTGLEQTGEFAQLRKYQELSGDADSSE